MGMEKGILKQILFNFSLSVFSWGVIALQCCVGSFCTIK